MDQTTAQSIHQLYTLRQAMAGRFPPIEVVPQFVSCTLGVLFPHFSPQSINSIETLKDKAARIEALLIELCTPILSSEREAHTVGREFVASLIHFHTLLKADAEALYEGDPAAKSIDEVILAYPGFFAIAVFRIANWLHQRSISIIPRVITEYAHHRTGVDIHPGVARK